MVRALLIAVTLAAPGDTLIRTNLGKMIPDTDEAPPPFLSIPFNISGPLFVEDANTVSHVYWNGTALVETKSNTWTQNGTVPQNVDSPLYPDGFSASSRKGAGPMDATNYYSLGSGSDVLDFTGDFTLCAVYTPVAPLGNTYVVTNGAQSAGGWILFGDTTQVALSFFTLAPGSSTISVATPPVTGGVNVVCGGRSSTTGLLATASGTGTVVVTAVASTTHPARIGNFTGSIPGNVFVYEVWATTTTPVLATLQALVARVYGQVTAMDAALTVVRSSSATYEVGGALWTAPAGALRVNGSGALIEVSRANNATYSEQIDNTTGWLYVGAGTGSVPVVTPDAAAGPFPGTLADQVVFALNGGTSGTDLSGIANKNCITTGTRTGSFWLRTTDGSTKTVRVGTTACPGLYNGGFANPVTVTGSWQRFSGTATTTGTTNRSLGLGLTGGLDSDSASLYVYGGQYEAGAPMTSYIPTTTTPATRQADVVSLANPFLATPNSFCVTQVVKDFDSSAFIGGVRAFTTAGTFGVNPSFACRSTATDAANMTIFGSGGSPSASDTVEPTLGAQFTVRCGRDPGNLSTVQIDDRTPGAQSGSPATWASAPTPLRIGTFNTTGNELSGFIENIKLFNAQCSKVRP